MRFCDREIPDRNNFMADRGCYSDAVCKNRGVDNSAMNSWHSVQFFSRLSTPDLQVAILGGGRNPRAVRRPRDSSNRPVVIANDDHGQWLMTQTVNECSGRHVPNACRRIQCTTDQPASIGRKREPANILRMPREDSYCLEG